MENRMIFEHLMCEAFDCQRGGYFFVNADHYDGATNHLEETASFLLCALINMKKKLPDKIELIDELSNKLVDMHQNGYKLSIMNNILQKAFDNHIIY